MKLRCCAVLQEALFTIFFMLFHKVVACLLLRWWLLTIFFMLFHKAVARLLLRWWLLTTLFLLSPDAAAGFLLQWFLRLCFCWCVAGAYFCALAVLGVLFLQGHHLCRAPSPFSSGGWSYTAYCALRPCPAKPALLGSAGSQALASNVALAPPPAARSASAGFSC